MNSIFMYLGNDYVKNVILDWSGSTPFGIKRGIKKYEDFPIVTSDEKLILKLLCGNNVYRPSMFLWILQKEKIPISHLHAWKLNGSMLELEDVSITIREEFKKKAALSNCILKDEGT